MDLIRQFVIAFSLVAVAASLIEGWIWSRRKPGTYDWKATWASLGMAVGRRVTELLPLSIAFPGGMWLYEHRLFEIDPSSIGGMVTLFLGLEFCYYWFHRATHRVRWFWASHAVHHSSNQMTLAAAYRLGWTSRISLSLVFFLPLCAVGFRPEVVAYAFTLNLLYQFWIHSAWVPSLGPLEGILNTPSAHRVHHAANLEYLDANYGGVLMLFDRLFGTYVPERADLPCRYGLVKPLTTNNPFKIAFHQWLPLVRDMAQARTIGEALAYAFKPPGWRPDGAGETTADLRRQAGIGGTALKPLVGAHPAGIAPNKVGG